MWKRHGKAFLVRNRTGHVYIILHPSITGNFLGRQMGHRETRELDPDKAVWTEAGSL